MSIAWWTGTRQVCAVLFGHEAAQNGNDCSYSPSPDPRSAKQVPFEQVRLLIDAEQEAYSACACACAGASHT
jgi:hypothetical protein